MTKSHLNHVKYQGVFSLMVIAALSLFLSSCTTDRQLAKQFVFEESRPEVILIKPETIYLVSYKDTEQDTTNLETWQIDSIRYSESKHLKNIDIEKFQRVFFEGFHTQFEAFDFKVYEGMDISKVLENDSTRPLVIKFPQMELEEYLLPYSDVSYFKGRKFFKNFELEAVDLNAWISLGRRSVVGSELYFVDDSITDVVDGVYFHDKTSGKVKYKFKYHELSLDNIYHFAADMGKNYAQYIFDHFLNRYVDVNRNKTYKRTYQYHYDPRNEKLMLIDELPWIKMDEKKSTE